MTDTTPNRPKGAKEWLLGDYDYAWLCMPTWPFGKARSHGIRSAPFFGIDEPIGLLVAVAMGLQHALAMVGGVITPPLLVYRVTVPDDQRDTAIEQYMISSALIVSGLCSIIQVTRFQIPTFGLWKSGRLFLGTGMVSVMGTSFTFLPIAQTMIRTMISDGDTWKVAYGRVLGTCAVAALLEVFMSFVPPKILKKVFPPVVTGTAVFLIGASLVGTGLRYWGGGVFCADNYQGLSPRLIDSCLVPDNSDGAAPDAPFVEGECYSAQIKPNCNTNGDVILPYGSPEYLGLGLVVFATLVVVELFGSPAMKNTQVIIGLLVGYVVATLVTVEGKSFVTSDKFDAAPVVTFLWVENFPLGFYAPGLLPLLIAFVVSTVESIGDVTATAEASQLDPNTIEQSERVQGGLLGDGISSLFAALATSLPNTTFSQNNGVISLTRCASRWAGISAAVWLLLLGVFAKVAAFITTIPDCVLGGMTTFLFANVMVSGIRILVSGPNGIGRRERFILSVALGVGLGVTIIPQFTQNALWPVTSDMSATLKGFRDAVLITLSTGYSIGVLLAVLLNFLLPHEREEPVHELDVSKAGPDFEYGQKGGPEYADTTLPAPPATNYADGPKPTEAMLRASDPRYVDGPVVQMHPVV